MIPRQVLTFLCPLVFAGCIVAKTEPPAVFRDFAVTLGKARVLAAGCPSIEINRPAVGASAQQLGRDLAAAGFTPTEINNFSQTVDQRSIDAEGQRWVAANGIDLEDPETVCPVADREIAADSDIAALLQRS